MIVEERFSWIGLGIIVAAATAFVYKLVSLVKGRIRKSELLEETLQDVALICLGASLMFGKGETGRIGLMAVFVALFGTYVGLRIWVWRRSQRGNGDGT